MSMVILIATIASSVSVVYYQYSAYTSKQIEDLSIQYIHSSADIQAYDLANSFSNKVRDVTSTLQVFAGAPAILENDLEKAKLLFDNAEKANSDIIDFYMWLDGDGKLVWLSNINQTSYEQFKGTDLGYRLYFTEARDTRQAYYSSVIDSNDRINRLYISYPILDSPPAIAQATPISTAQFRGVVVAGLRLDVVGQFLEKQISPTLQSEVAVLDNRGIILYSKDDQYIGKNVFGVRFQSFLASLNVETLGEMNSGFKAALAGKSGSVDITDADNKNATFVYKPISIEERQFGVLYMVTPHEYAASVGFLIDQQETFSLLLIVLIAAASIGIIFVFLTWNKRLEKIVNLRTSQLQSANEKLAAHDKMQQEFINIAAHELRTPVQPILGMSELLESELGDKREDIRMIARNARRLERLAQDILDVTRIESQSLKLVKERFDIGELIATIIQDYQRRIVNGDSTELEFHGGGNASLVVEGDRERISQVVTNLIDNALKFAKGGKVTVTARKEDAGKMVSVSVNDTGTGIDSDMLARLFTKFSSKGERGTGLGLFISKNIVEAHGGKIWGTNNGDGRGATFTFTLPVGE